MSSSALLLQPSAAVSDSSARATAGITVNASDTTKRSAIHQDVLPPSARKLTAALPLTETPPVAAAQRRILIIEPQPLAQNYLRFALERLGFQQLTFVERANAALELCSKSIFDLIICAFDLQEGKDGFQLCQELKSRQLQPPHTGIIFLSAETDTGLVHSVLELQPDEFLAKPFLINELQQRINRVFSRKQWLSPVLDLLAAQQVDTALALLDQMLVDADYRKARPVLLRFKGDLLLDQRQFAKAQQWFEAILQQQPYPWARIGLVKALHAQPQQPAMLEQLMQLSANAESRLFALEAQADIAYAQGDVALSLQLLDEACQLAPRNLWRQQKILQLSRLNHDYERQYQAARDLVKFGRHSMHEHPAMYLTLARACLDFANSQEDAPLQSRLNRQLNDCFQHLRRRFPDQDTSIQQQVLQARLLYVQDQKHKALRLMEKLPDEPHPIESIEDVIDQAKAYHEVGLSQLATHWLQQAMPAAQHIEDALLRDYLQQELQERSSLSRPPKELNNIAVMHYQQGNWQAALQAFRHAFQLLPRHSGIALNLLQSILTAPHNALPATEQQQLIQACIRVLSQTEGSRLPQEHSEQAWATDAASSQQQSQQQSQQSAQPSAQPGSSSAQRQQGRQRSARKLPALNTEQRKRLEMLQQKYPVPFLPRG
jgi:DNA-binding response OmpR family regulator